ncbi:DUF1573 domain-containing protein [Fibrella sp. WM1]|uniref:DUF1573 domain-containing protein n=1 Tax=Fibrella musci TaxID=3242485 RepID=UPI00352191A0
MKNTFPFLVALLLLAGTVFAHTLASFGWTKTVQELGRIPQGKPVTVTYAFTNTGTTPLVVTKAQGSCGCTGVEWPKEAILPGASGQINATFNAAALGTFNKSVFVESNAGEGVTTLQFKGEVVSGEAVEKP